MQVILQTQMHVQGTDAKRFQNIDFLHGTAIPKISPLWERNYFMHILMTTGEHCFYTQQLTAMMKMACVPRKKEIISLY